MFLSLRNRKNTRPGPEKGEVRQSGKVEVGKVEVGEMEVGGRGKVGGARRRSHSHTRDAFLASPHQPAARSPARTFQKKSLFSTFF